MAWSMGWQVFIDGVIPAPGLAAFALDTNTVSPAIAMAGSLPAGASPSRLHDANFEDDLEFNVLVFRHPSSLFDDFEPVYISRLFDRRYGVPDGCTVALVGDADFFYNLKFFHVWVTSKTSFATPHLHALFIASPD